MSDSLIFFNLPVNACFAFSDDLVSEFKILSRMRKKERLKVYTNAIFLVGRLMVCVL